MKKKKNKFRSISHSVTVSPFIHNIVFAHKTAQHEQSDDETTDGCVQCRQWNDKTALVLENKAKSARLHFSVNNTGKHFIIFINPEM